MMLTSPLLSAVPGLRHAFFSREGGVSTGIYQGLNAGIGSYDDPAHVAENRRRMAEQMGVAPTHFLTAHQIHSPDVVVATTPWAADARPRADAIVTQIEGLSIGATAADCGPILFVDPSARVIGAAHAGWKGALTGVLVGIALSLLELIPYVRRLRLTVDEREDEHGRTIGLSGAATFVSLPKLSDRLEAVPGGAPVRLDLSACSGVDHTCAELLKDWLQRRRAAGGSVELSGAQGRLAALAH